MNAPVAWTWGMPVVDVSMNLDDVVIRLAHLEVLYKGACYAGDGICDCGRNFWDAHGREYTALVTIKNSYDTLNEHFEIQLANATMTLCPSVDCPNCFYYIKP